MNLVYRILLILLASSPGAFALYQEGKITAYQVEDGKIVIDGKPEALWKAVAARRGFATLDFRKYESMVVLGSVADKNADPRSKVPNPPTGSASMLVAYDNTALYFFFLVKEDSIHDGGDSCGSENLWKSNSVEVFVDPSAWDPDLLQAYFTADASNLVFGTSNKTIQVGRRINPQDARWYYRDRSRNNQFALRIPNTNNTSVSLALRVATDSTLVGVEMKVPFQTGLLSSYSPGNSMFISWGYNHSRNKPGGDCSENPLAYRWAKNFKTYAGTGTKPPGWIANDSIHYDPIRSYDGWGRLDLHTSVVNETECPNMGATDWDIQSWLSQCSAATAVKGFARKSGDRMAKTGRQIRDLKGRYVPIVKKDQAGIPTGEMIFLR